MVNSFVDFEQLHTDTQGGWVISVCSLRPLETEARVWVKSPCAVSVHRVLAVPTLQKRKQQTPC